MAADKFKYFDENGDLMPTDDERFGEFRAPDGTCSYPGCEATYRDHEWGTKKAQAEGWFFQKNDDRWCPKHTPAWVAGWRAKQQQAKSEQSIDWSDVDTEG